MVSTFNPPETVRLDHHPNYWEKGKMFQATNQNITDQSQLETQIDKRSLKAKPKYTPLEGPMFQDHYQNDHQDRRAVLASSAMHHQSSTPKMGSPDKLHECLKPELCKIHTTPPGYKEMVRT